MENSNQGLSQDEIFDILSNERRRYILFYIKRHGGPVNLMELVRELAAREEDTTPEPVSDQAEKRVYISLYQTHIPRLEEAGFIEYDADSNLLSLGDASSAVGRYIGPSDSQVDDEDGPRWYLYYLAAVAVAGLFLIGTKLGIAGLNPVSVSHLSVLMIAVLGVAHLIYTT